APGSVEVPEVDRGTIRGDGRADLAAVRAGRDLGLLARECRAPVATSDSARVDGAVLRGGSSSSCWRTVRAESALLLFDRPDVFRDGISDGLDPAGHPRACDCPVRIFCRS